MLLSPPFKNTLEPLVPLITDAFGLHRSNAYRNATVFEEHVVRVLGHELPRSGRARQLMIDQELWTVFQPCFTAYHTGQQPSFSAALANGYSGDSPGARSLDDVHQSVVNQRETLAELQGWLTEQVARQDRELSDLRSSLGELRDFLQTEFGRLQTEGWSPVRRDVTALRKFSAEQGGRQEESGTARHAEVMSALVTHGEQLDHLTEGMRVIAEVVSAMADQFPDADADPE